MALITLAMRLLVFANGVCKACSKGLCHGCAADLGYGIACKGSHEERARDLEMIMAKNATAIKDKDARKNLYIVPLFYITMGCCSPLIRCMTVANSPNFRS